MLLADLARSVRLTLAAAGVGEATGAAESLNTNAGAGSAFYELRFKGGPIAVRIGADGQALTVEDVRVDETDEPFRFAVPAGATVRLASASSAAVYLCALPLVRVE